jgi:hypothetical protein
MCVFACLCYMAASFGRMSPLCAGRWNSRRQVKLPHPRTVIYSFSRRASLPDTLSTHFSSAQCLAHRQNLINIFRIEQVIRANRPSCELILLLSRKTYVACQTPSHGTSLVRFLRCVLCRGYFHIVGMHVSGEGINPDCCISPWILIEAIKSRKHELQSQSPNLLELEAV